MSGSTPGAGPVDVLAVTVHGPGGVLDLVVPAAASATDVVVEYAGQAGVGTDLRLCSSTGRPLSGDVPLGEAGVPTGSVLVALGADATPERARRVGPFSSDRARGEEEPARARMLAALLATAAALLAGWWGAGLPDSMGRTSTVVALALGALVGCLPLGGAARTRVLAAPAFAAAAAWVVVWDPLPERLPMLVGICALAAAVTAGVARAADELAEDSLRVWIVGGLLVFLLTGGTTLIGARPQVAWALLLLAAMLAARFVPVLAVDVPDQYLIDIERLAVTAWSARERPPGRRGRTVVPRSAVAEVAARGARTVTAASAAVLVVVSVAVPLLLATATASMDRIGARCLVGLTGAALLLAARSYRHTAARTLLRAAALVCAAWLYGVLLSGAGPATTVTLVVVPLLLGAVAVAVAVASGRGWRSAWWSRRAEVAESVSGAFAIGAVVVAVGLFRHLWELTG